MTSTTTPDAVVPRQGNTLPIVAILAGALVGVVSPVAVAAVARRSKRELDASAERQRAALDAERERLETTLVAEAERQRRETERILLDRGTTLISEFRDAVAYVTLDARGMPAATDRWRQAVHALATFRGRLLLWFEEGGEIVEAFDGVTAFTSWSTTWASELRAGEHKVKLTRGSNGNGASAYADPNGYALEDVDLRHLRYVVAARAHLRPDRNVQPENVARVPSARADQRDGRAVIPPRIAAARPQG
ncbi:MAG TPA: hypothetical protein VHX66_15485 [Solirubrobacteraceae bacterium]|nr:hypothetical protein [Solirubrobacteraceae bacterium]